jgi:hypothetical protein
MTLKIIFSGRVMCYNLLKEVDGMKKKLLFVYVRLYLLQSNADISSSQRKVLLLKL